MKCDPPRLFGGPLAHQGQGPTEQVGRGGSQKTEDKRREQKNTGKPIHKKLLGRSVSKRQLPSNGPKAAIMLSDWRCRVSVLNIGTTKAGYH